MHCEVTAQCVVRAIKTLPNQFFFWPFCGLSKFGLSFFGFSCRVSFALFFEFRWTHFYLFMFSCLFLFLHFEFNGRLDMVSLSLFLALSLSVSSLLLIYYSMQALVANVYYIIIINNVVELSKLIN